ncbi:MAG: tetratricopeptide repeat protein, partial [Polyangiaceae bacterium]
VLPAVQYLDEMGFVYCDFKPENAMVEEDAVKLIDLGAVRMADDTQSDVYGSKGYTAPEAHDAPTALSDLYSVARALAVLVADFDFQGKYEGSLPPAAEVPAFAANDALYRLLTKATRQAPAARFQSASELAAQLVGVLRHVQGAGEVPRIESEVFEPDSDPGLQAGEHRGHDGIPRLKVDHDDAAAGVILAAGGVGDPERRLQLFERALLQQPRSTELALRRIDELVTLGRFGDAESALRAVRASGQADWRLAWYHGRALLGQGKVQETLEAFRSILGEMPGELAPQQAVARAYEAGGDLDEALRYYDAVSRADPGFTSAAFGLARCRERRGDRAGAAEAYRRVPATSARYVAAQMALARALLHDASGAPPSFKDVKGAAEALDAVAGQLEGIELHELRARVLLATARLAEAGFSTQERVLGVRVQARVLRRAAEEELRACARMAGVESERIRWVDEANRVRPVSWI